MRSKAKAAPRTAVAPVPRIGRPRIKRERLIAVRLSAEAYAALEKRAQAEDRKIAYVARRAIIESLGLPVQAA